MILTEPFIQLAHKLADLAGPIINGYFRQNPKIDDKDDLSPVTAADREAEAAMRAAITEAFPGHGILGEEFGPENTDAEYVWVLDPIDGTKAFITGKPLFGTLIALTQNGVPVLGIIDQPVLGERWAGCQGQKSTFNGKAITTRACAALSDAWLYATTPHMFEGDDFTAFTALTDRVKQALYGADCYAYGLLASGFTDIVCEASLKPYDFCAVVPVIKGAGGIMTDWSGAPLTIHSDGRVLAAGDKQAHQAALEVLGGG
ncbi:MAG: histidinol-phosphatase [Rhodospirillales bacterium]|nr:histidinol-phosphatase [Rhodospirillales bacterium]